MVRRSAMRRVVGAKRGPSGGDRGEGSRRLSGCVVSCPRGAVENGASCSRFGWVVLEVQRGASMRRSGLLATLQPLILHPLPNARTSPGKNRAHPSPEGGSPRLTRKFSGAPSIRGRGILARTSPEKREAPPQEGKRHEERRGERDPSQGQGTFRNSKRVGFMQRYRDTPPPPPHLRPIFFSPPLPPLSACLPLPAAPAPFRASPLCYFGTSSPSPSVSELAGSYLIRYNVSALATGLSGDGEEWDGAAVFRALFSAVGRVDTCCPEGCRRTRWC